jgi:copper transport protein
MAGGSVINTRLFAAIMLASLACLTMPASAAAHADLVGSTPAANSSLPDGPDELVLEFSEPVDPATVLVRVLDPQQTEIETPGDPLVEADGERLRLALPALEAGVYTVEYRVVSTVDGHATGGIFAFLIDPTGIEPAPAMPTETVTTSDDPATIAARWVALIGGLVLFGVAAFWLFSASPAISSSACSSMGRVAVWPMLAGAALLSFTGTASYLLLAARALAGPAARATEYDVHGPAGFPFDFAAPFGWTPFAIAMRVSLLAALVAFLIAAALYVFADEQRRRGATAQGGPPRVPLVGVLLASVVILAGFSAAGHASSYGGPVFASFDWLHLVGVGAWLGALPGLLLVGVLAKRAAVPLVVGAALRRHGRMALVAAPLVALTGVANAPLVLGDNRDLVATGYGNLVLAKVLLFSVAVGIGSVNFVLGRGSRGRVALPVIGAEVVIAAFAVLAAAAMVTVQPASAQRPILSASALNTAHLYGAAGQSSVHAAVDLPAPGSQTYQAVISDLASGVPRSDVQRVFFLFEPPDESGLPAERIELEQGEPPWLFGTRGAHTPLVGEWTLEVIVRRAGELDESVRFPLSVVQPLPPQPVPAPSTGLVAPAPLAWLWAALPAGARGWLIPALLVGSAGVLAGWEMGRRRRGAALPAWGPSMRTALVSVAVVTAIGIGSRQLVEAANQPPPERAAVTSPVPADADSIARGHSIYVANCAACHGPDGDPDRAVLREQAAPRPLDRSVTEMSEAELAWLIATGRAGTRMPAFADAMSENDRWDLVNYLSDRWQDD